MVPANPGPPGKWPFNGEREFIVISFFAVGWVTDEKVLHRQCPKVLLWKTFKDAA